MRASDWIEARLRAREAATPGRRFSHVENAAAVAAVALRERSIPYWPITDIEELQRRRIRALIHHAYETVPFYRNVMQERGLVLNTSRPGPSERSGDEAHRVSSRFARSLGRTSRLALHTSHSGNFNNLRVAPERVL